MELLIQQGCISFPKIFSHLKTALPEVKHEASSIQGSTNMRHHHTKSGHHSYLVPGIVHPCSMRTTTFPSTHMFNTSASHSKVLILYLVLEIIIFKVYMIFLGPDKHQVRTSKLMRTPPSCIVQCVICNH